MKVSHKILLEGEKYQQSHQIHWSNFEKKILTFRLFESTAIVSMTSRGAHSIFGKSHLQLAILKPFGTLVFELTTVPGDLDTTRGPVRVTFSPFKAIKSEFVSHELRLWQFVYLCLQIPKHLENR